MRILFVAPWLPSRIRPRSLGLLTMLARRHQVWFVGLDAAGETSDDLAAIPLAGTTLVPLKTTSAVLRAGRAALRGSASLQAAYVAEPAMSTALRRVVRQFEPDVAHLNVIRSAAYLPALTGLPVVFDLDDIRSDYYQQRLDEPASASTRLLSRLELPRMRALEASVVERSRVALVSAPDDVERVGPRGCLVRSPHQFEGVTRSAVPGSPPTVLFVGRLGYAPNVEGVRWFAERVMPRALDAVPDARLLIVGERPPPAVQRLASEHVEVLGRVRDLTDLYARADVAVVPINVGTGVQMKLVQALACGVPTVATSRALRRAGVTPGREALAADDEDSWVSSVTDLLAGGPAASALGAAGRDWASARASDAAIERSLLRAYASAGFDEAELTSWTSVRS